MNPMPDRSSQGVYARSTAPGEFAGRLALTVLLSFFLLVPGIGATGQTQSDLRLSGTFRPSGPPEDPVRTKVGSACVVDLRQNYDLEGSLAGEMKIDYRIFVDGDCTKPPGTFDEHWISYGTYAVLIRETKFKGALTSIATVRAGGSIDGTLTLDGELSAELHVSGNFKDSYVSYSGTQISPESQ